MNARINRLAQNNAYKDTVIDMTDDSFDEERLGIVRLLFPFIICKILLCVTYFLWDLFWKFWTINVCSFLFMYVVIFTIVLLSTIGISVVMTYLQPNRISVHTMKDYTTVCLFSLVGYIFMCMSQAYYVSLRVLSCQTVEVTDQYLISALFLGLGIILFLIEVFFGIGYCKNMLTNNEKIYKAY